jgi:hypothetical protein
MQGPAGPIHEGVNDADHLLDWTSSGMARNGTSGWREREAVGAEQKLQWVRPEGAHLNTETQRRCSGADKECEVDPGAEDREG